MSCENWIICKLENVQICKCGFFNEDGKIIAIEERSVCRKINHNIELQRGDLFNAQMNKICKPAYGGQIVPEESFVRISLTIPSVRLPVRWSSFITIFTCIPGFRSDRLISLM